MTMTTQWAGFVVVGPTVHEIIQKTLAAGVTFRRYGQNGELKRPMIHRFPASKLRGAVSVAEAVGASHNRLLTRLVARHGARMESAIERRNESQSPSHRARPNGIVNVEYDSATFRLEGCWLVVTHRDEQKGEDLLSRLPLVNVVQVLEVLPKKN